MTEPHQTLAAFVYVLGVLLTPFFFSLIDGWPLIKPRDDKCTGLAALLCCLLWPGVLLMWLLIVWWCGVSWLGYRARRLLTVWWCGASWLGYRARRLLEAAWGRLRR